MVLLLYMLLMLVLVSFESCRSPLQHGTLIHPRTHSMAMVGLAPGRF